MLRLTLEEDNRVSYLVTKKERTFQKSLELLQPVGGKCVFNEPFLHLLLLEQKSDYCQEPITRSVQLPYEAYVTAILQTGLFLGISVFPRNGSARVYMSAHL